MGHISWVERATGKCWRLLESYDFQQSAALVSVKKSLLPWKGSVDFSGRERCKRSWDSAQSSQRYYDDSSETLDLSSLAGETAAYRPCHHD